MTKETMKKITAKYLFYNTDTFF